MFTIADVVMYLMWIPIRIENNDSVSALQVESEPAGTSRQQEKEVFRVFVVKLLKQLATVLCFSHTVQSNRQTRNIYINFVLLSLVYIYRFLVTLQSTYHT